MIWRPRCIMNPVFEPTDPIVRISPPFWSMPERAPARPWITRSPPRIAARRERAGVAVDDDDARHHVLAGGPADAALDVDLRPVDQPAAVVAEAALERDLAALQDADADRVLGAGILDRHVGDAALVDEAAQLEVDLARRQVLGVEDGLVAVDLRHVGDGVVRLHEPAGVVDDPRSPTSASIRAPPTHRGRTCRSRDR